ncbi:High affinity nitrate transporter 2.5 [Thalictrum thalictroides]|uniref:High affinity nitrate transporter 2.5 n=1 Tax=Thalictrum thalictroides TaxID=46969 RepID=A0A7J6WR15_THATH|nr:High affinity nitrate transporter 2.5 [Thalictrum thalictroides]
MKDLYGRDDLLVLSLSLQKRKTNTLSKLRVDYLFKLLLIGDLQSENLAFFSDCCSPYRFKHGQWCCWWLGNPWLWCLPATNAAVHQLETTTFIAWLIAFFIPAMFQTLTTFALFIYGQDLPEEDGYWPAMTYGYCFRVELTIDNTIAEYFYDSYFSETEI